MARIKVQFFKTIKYFIKRKYYAYKNYQILKLLNRKYGNNEKIRVGLFVMYDSNVAHLSLIPHLIDSGMFEPIIIVIPDAAREEFRLENINKTYKLCKNLYPDIKTILPFSDDISVCRDISGEIDMGFSNIPYSSMLNMFFSTDYLISRKVLMVNIAYCVLSSEYFAFKHILNQGEILKAWRVFVENQFAIEFAKDNSDYKAYNLKSFGYLKMDGLLSTEVDSQKTVMIAPHHSIGDRVPELSLSNFLKYSDLFLELPNMYPEINFIFRPHPLLNVALCDVNYWGKAKTDEYFSKMSSYKNVEYQQGGDYLSTFSKLSGIITDCSSFLLEYLYTKKQGCYLLKNDRVTSCIFTDFGKKCLNEYFIAYEEDDIIRYLECVRDDSNKIIESSFVDGIRHNHTNVGRLIVDYIAQAIKEAK